MSSKMSRDTQLFLFFTLLVSSNAKFYSDFISDFITFKDKHAIVTEFSCNQKESAILFSKVTTNGHLINILSTNVTDIPYPNTPNLRYFVLNLDCSESKQLLQKVNSFKYFASPFRWIVFSKKTLINSTTQNFLENYFSKVDILIDSDVNFAQAYENNETVIVEKVFKKRHNCKIDIESFGYWMKSRGFAKIALFEDLAFRRRKNLLGTTLKSCIVITHNDSLNHLTDKRDKHIDSIAKVNYVLVNHLADIYNISLKYSVQSSWGYKNNKSEWSGMIGELIRNEADIGGTPLFFTKDRAYIIDYIAMTTPTRSKFVFRQPKLSYVTNVYTLPFDTKVWLCTIVLMVIGIWTLYIVIKWEWKKKNFQQNEAEKSTLELKDSFLEVAFFTMGALCQQGAASLPFSLPGRVTSYCLFLSLMFLYTSYAANIVALLQSSSTNIKTLTDLLHSRLKVGVDDTVYSRYYFPNNKEPTRRALYTQKIAPKGKMDNFLPIEVGVRRMREGLFAFHMETGSGYKIVSETFEEDEKCGLQEISFLQVIDPWLAVQKNSSYKEMLKIGLQLIQESGIQNREVGLIYTKKPICSSKSSTFISVGFVDCYPAIAILAGGLAISVTLFVFEFYVKHRIKFYRKQWSNRFGSGHCNGYGEATKNTNKDQAKFVQDWKFVN